MFVSEKQTALEVEVLIPEAYVEFAEQGKHVWNMLKQWRQKFKASFDLKIYEHYTTVSDTTFLLKLVRDEK